MSQEAMRRKRPLLTDVERQTWRPIAQRQCWVMPVGWYDMIWHVEKNIKAETLRNNERKTCWSDASYCFISFLQDGHFKQDTFHVSFKRTNFIWTTKWIKSNDEYIMRMSSACFVIAHRAASLRTPSPKLITTWYAPIPWYDTASGLAGKGWFAIAFSPPKTSGLFQGPSEAHCEDHWSEPTPVNTQEGREQRWR